MLPTAKTLESYATKSAYSKHDKKRIICQEKGNMLIIGNIV